MTRVALVVSDVDGTLVTREKVLTDAARDAVRRLSDAGIAFTIVSSRPTVGMHFLIEPLAITLPVGSFNGSSIVDPQLNPIEQHLIPAAVAQTSLDVLDEFGAISGCSPTTSGSPATAMANSFRTKYAPSGPIRPSSATSRLT